jgi:hypothetical protein
MGMIEFSKGFFVFDKSWIHDNKFFQSLSHAEFRILIYLLSSGLKVSKKDERFKQGDLIPSLYQRSKLLAVNASQRRIAEKSKADRGTVIKALKKFKDFGVVIKFPGGREPEVNDLYIVGFEYSMNDKTGKLDYYLVDSIPIRAGQKLPEKYRTFILNHYNDDLFRTSDLIWDDLFGKSWDDEHMRRLN